ncbi:MAG: hypothetical protein GKR96_12870 [Gammaproteobacteria bacterium]|nr:hypothetical protein [Gammaproteobacteria bacterium]
MLKILVAFKSEAIPLIAHFGLSRNDCVDRYPLYASEYVKLIICGIGSKNALRATTILSEYGRDSDRWLNFGVAGSGGYVIGDFVVGGRVLDFITGDQWSLASCEDADLQVGEICCVNEVQKTYRGDTVYDMESAGFLRGLDVIGATQKGICLKLISDGPTNADILTLKSIKQLMHNRTSELTQILYKLFPAS